jgi:copper chaperone CopZ
MRSIVKKTGIVLLACFGTLLLSFELKAQTQEKQNTIKMERTEMAIETLQLKVEGMSCQAGCANGIDNTIRKEDGIVKSTTTFDSGISEIRYDKSKISEKEIIDLIEKRGFKTQVKEEGE